MHDKTISKALAHEQQQCEAEVNAIYAVRDELSAYDRQLLDTPAEEQLNRPTQVIRRWIERTKPLIQHCIRDQILRLKNGHSDIRNFFTNEPD